MVTMASHLQSAHEKETLRRSLQTTQGEIAETRQGLTQAQQKQAAAEQALREVRAQQRARTLTQGQYRALVEQLQAGPKGRVRIQFPVGDAEAQRYANQFYETLHTAGWTVESLGQVQRIFGELPVGLELAASRPSRTSPAEMPPCGEFLLRVLRDVGLEVSLGIPHLDSVPTEVVYLVVGAKSQPR
jgi:hypothetical protein